MSEPSVEHQTEQSLTEAIESLTVGEIRVIERHYGRSLDSGQLSGTDLTVAVVWALERRKALGPGHAGKLPDWADLDSWTMKRLNAYFTPEAIETDAAEPETEQGKGDTPGE